MSCSPVTGHFGGEAPDARATIKYHRRLSQAASSHPTQTHATTNFVKMQAIAASSVVAPARQFNGAKKSFSVKKVGARDFHSFAGFEKTFIRESCQRWAHLRGIVAHLSVNG